jgi:all-trans-retinol dehydrogenase (NAD+)
MAGTPLRGSTVLVTGGGSGIGRLMAEGAAARGAEVVVWDLAESAQAPVGHRVQRVDVSDPEQVRAAAVETGPVDVLVNNAGVVTGKHLLDAEDAQIRRTFDVNVLALYWTTRAFLPGMLERDRGTVVTVASAAGLVGVAKQTDYSASKHAAVGFDESLRAELRTMRSRVRTLVVCPYYIDTGMFEGVRTRVPLLLPILQEQRVADAVLNGVERGRRRLVLPPLVRAVPALRILPVRAFDAVNDLLGVNKTMDRFVGRR